ncbi:MAG: hypothetical protein WB689_22275 [Xanthobacteraceae bacterium]
MSKILAAVLLMTLIHGTAASARGSGAGNMMPGTNFTDMPSYLAKTVEPVKRIKRKHVRWRQGAARDD